jgi:hypothetical protein
MEEFIITERNGNHTLRLPTLAHNYKPKVFRNIGGPLKDG